jgi:hypothetical protein
MAYLLFSMRAQSAIQKVATHPQLLKFQQNMNYGLAGEDRTRQVRTLHWFFYECECTTESNEVLDHSRIDIFTDVDMVILEAALKVGDLDYLIYDES